MEIDFCCGPGGRLVFYWSHARAFIDEFAERDLCLLDDKIARVPERSADAARHIRDQVWRDQHRWVAGIHEVGVSSELFRLLSRKYGVPDAAVAVVFERARSIAANFAPSESRSTRQRHSSPTSNEATETSPMRRPLELPRSSTRRRRGGEGRGDDAMAQMDQLIEAAEGAEPLPSPPTSPRRSQPTSHRPTFDELESVIIGWVAATRSRAESSGVLKGLARVLGVVYGSLSSTKRDVLLVTLFKEAVEGSKRPLRKMRLSNLICDFAISALHHVNRRGLLRLLEAITARFRPKVTRDRRGIRTEAHTHVSSHSKALHERLPDDRQERRRRADRRNVAKILGDLHSAMNGLDERSATTSGSPAPVPTLELAESFAAGTFAAAADADADDSAEAGVAKAASALVSLLRVVAPGPTMAHVLEETDYGAMVVNLRFDRVWATTERVNVALAFNILKRRGGISGVVFDQAAKIIDGLLREACGAPSGAIIVPRVAEQRTLATQHPELFETPINDARVSATHENDADGSGSVRLDFGFALTYDALARASLFDELISRLHATRPDGDAAPFPAARHQPAPDQTVVEANRDAARVWLEFRAAAPSDNTIILVFVTLHTDAAHLARSRTLVKTIEATSMILGVTFKQALVNRTEQSILVFAADVGDGADKLRPHVTAATPAVPSVAAQVARLKGEGVDYPHHPGSCITFMAKLLLAAYDLKGIKELLRKLGFGAERDMPWSNESRYEVSRYVEDLGFYHYAPIAYRDWHVRRVYQLGGLSALREVLAITALPEFNLDPRECAHGGLHCGTEIKALLTQMCKLYFEVGGQDELDGFLAYISGRLPWPVQCNFKAKETTWPYGGKTGQMLEAGTTRFHALLGYESKLHRSDKDPEGTIQFVLDAIVSFNAIAGLVRNHHLAFVAFADFAVAAAVTANGLIALAFKNVYVSQRVNSDFLAHTIQACRRASQEAGYTITLEECLETKVEDLHRHVARFWLACLRGGGKGTKAEIACRTMRFIMKELSFYQMNVLEKTKLLGSLKSLMREEMARRKRAAALYETAEEDAPGEFAKSWSAKTEGDDSVLGTLLRHASSASTAPRRPGADAGSDGFGVDAGSDGVGVGGVPDGEGAGDGDGDSSSSDEDEVETEANNAGRDDEGDEGNADEAPVAADDDDELAVPEEELEEFSPMSVSLLSVKMQVASHMHEVNTDDTDEWTVVMRTSKQGRGHEVRVELRHGTDSSRSVFYRVIDENIYAHELNESTQNDKCRLRFLLLGPPDFGVFNTKTNNFNLASKGASDTGPFKAISATTTLMTLTARPAAEPKFTTLHIAWGNMHRASAYLLARTRAEPVIPRAGAPEAYEKSRADEAARDKAKTMPLAVEGERSRIRAQAEKLIAAFLAHVEYVISNGTRGKAIRRSCRGCKKTVFIGRDGSHYLDDGATQPRHDECFAKVEAYINKHSPPAV